MIYAFGRILTSIVDSIVGNIWEIQMKATERHELKKSEMEKMMEKAQDFFQKHGTKVFGAIIVIIVLFTAIWYVNNSAKVARQQALEQILAIQSGRSTDAKPEDLRAIAEETSDDKVAALAWKLYGDGLYNQTLTDEKAKVKELLMQAEQAYNKVISDYSDETLTVAGAKLGLGAVYEDQAKWNQAAQVYQQVSNDNNLKNTGMQEIAKGKLAELASVEKSAKTPLPSSQPAVTQTKPATSPATKLAK
jgi:large-conductance mechanosensitive channel